jgi:hypothetical protein
MGEKVARSILYGVGGSLSLFSDIVLIYIHIKIPSFREHPGSLIMGQCIANILLDLHWFTGISPISE